MGVAFPIPKPEWGLPFPLREKCIYIEDAGAEEAEEAYSFVPACLVNAEEKQVVLNPILGK